MIEIPLNKALVAIEVENCVISDCNGCYLRSVECCDSRFACRSHNREDGKNVIYDLVDYSAKEKRMTEIIITGDWSTDQLQRIKDVLNSIVFEEAPKEDLKLADEFISQAVDQINFGLDASKSGGMR